MVEEDLSECNNLAEENPEKLTELRILVDGKALATGSMGATVPERFGIDA